MDVRRIVATFILNFLNGHSLQFLPVNSSILAAPERLFLAEALLDEEPTDVEGALSLIHEGARIAADHADERKGSGYADVMLRFDVDRANRLVQRAGAISAEPGS